MARTDVPPPQDHKTRRLQYDMLKLDMRDSIDLIASTVLNSGGELDLQIRSNYFNVYYMGGSLWNVSNISPMTRGMQITVDPEYFNRESGVVLNSSWIPKPKAPFKEWLETLSKLKGVLDGWFAIHDNRERQLQHNLAVNHLSNQNSGWIILDVEYAAWLHGAKKGKKTKESRRLCKFDLLGVKREDLNRTQALPVYVMELKQGNGSIEGESSITSHAEDMEQLICDKADVRAKNALIESIRLSFLEKQTLGLMPNISADLSVREIRLKPAFILEGVDKTPELRAQKTKAEMILSDFNSDIPWLDYDEMKNATIER